MTRNSGDAPAPRQPRVVDSLEAALPGDFIPLGRRGAVMSRRRYRVGRALGWLWFTFWVGFVGLFWGGLAHSLFVGLASASVTAAILLTRWQRSRRALIGATVSLTEGRPDEARASLAALEGMPLDQPTTFARDYIDYRTDWIVGARPEALAKCERLCRMRPGDARLASERAWLLAVEGRAADARAALETAPAARGDLHELGRAGAQLRVGFLTGEVPAHFDSERLHGLARRVLATSLFGGLCVLLAWAFESRREPEMARHLLDEAPARFGGARWEPFDPALHAWFVATGEPGGA